MVRPGEIVWEVLKAAAPELDRIRDRMTSDAFTANREALRAYLCDYFNSADGSNCDHKQGNGISPIGLRTGRGGKCLKVRWLVPGQGKSGGLRLLVVAYCNEKRVKLAGAWLRRDDPADADFAAAAAEA